VSTPGTTSSLT